MPCDSNVCAFRNEIHNIIFCRIINPIPCSVAGSVITSLESSTLSIGISTSPPKAVRNLNWLWYEGANGLPIFLKAKFFYN